MFKSALVIGLGGTGVFSLKHLKAELTEATMLRQLPQNVKYVAIDTVQKQSKAAEGDIDPLLRLLEAFSCNLTASSGSIPDVLSLLLARARVIHEEPVDETLWDTISNAIKTRIAEQGSESAA